MRSRDPRELVDALLQGDRSTLPRLLTLIERGGAPARLVGELTHTRAGAAYTVGLTGAPGAGKSTLVNALVKAIRAQDLEVGVLCVDPSSPFTKGAILGDRVRMPDHALDPGVFIRSMATRGHLGGLSLATPQAIRVLDAAGFPLVLVETVGVGQVEVEIAGAADTTVVVVNPGWGDSVQANKAGLLEVADVFVVNKAERPEADRAVRDLDEALDIATRERHRPAIVKTSALTGEGVPELCEAIDAHRQWLDESGELERRRSHRVDTELRELVLRQLEEKAMELCGTVLYGELRADVTEHRLDPWSAADKILGGLA